MNGLQGITGLDPTSVYALLAALGLSLSAGVRAYLPFVALGIASNISTLNIHLRSGFEWIGNPFVIGIFVFLTIYEISADKIPVVDHLNDIVHTFIRPLSGAVLFASTSNTLTDNGTVGIVIAALLGATLAGTTHAAKAGIVRPASTVTTAGLANPFISLLEDIGAFATVILSILAPIVVVVIFVVFMFFIIRGISTLMRRRRAKAAALAH